MAQVALGVVGGAIGFMLGGPAGAAIGFGIGMALTPEMPGATIGEIAKQTAKEGDPRLIVWGIVRPVGPNIIACEDPPRTYQVSQGGKGSGPTSEAIYRTYALGVCEGPITGYRRIWRNNKLVYDGRPGSLWGAYNNAVFLQKATFYYGTYDQMPDPNLEAVFGAGEVPAHRGTAYIVIADEDLTDTGGAVPQWLFEVIRDAGDYAPLPPESSEIMIAHGSSPRVTRLSVEDWSELPNIAPTGSGTAYAAEYSSDGEHAVISLDSNPRLRVIEISSGDEVASHSLVGNSTGRISRAPGAPFLGVAGVGAQRLYFINATNWSIYEPPNLISNATGVEFSPATADAAVSAFYGYYNPPGVSSNLSIYRLGYSSAQRVEQDPEAGVQNNGNAVAWSKDGQRIYLAQSSNTNPIRVMNAAGVTVGDVIGSIPSGVSSVDTHPNNTHIAIGLANGTLQYVRVRDAGGNSVWDVEHEITGLSSSIISIRFSNSGGYIAYGAIGVNPRLYVANTQTWAQEIPGGRIMPGAIWSIRWSPK